MTCKAVRENLALYALSELDRNTEAAITAHLETCAECRSERDAVTREVAVLRGALGTDMIAPAALLDGVQKEIAARMPKRTWRWPAWGIVPAAVVAATALFLLWPKGHHHVHPGSDLDAVLMDADLFAPSTVPVADEAHGLAMLSGRVGYAVVSPGLARMGAAFTGCRTCKEPAGDVALLDYRKDGRDLVVLEQPAAKSTFDAEERRTVGGKAFFCCSHGGASAVAWQRDGRVFILAAKLPQSDLLTLAAGAANV